MTRNLTKFLLIFLVVLPVLFFLNTDFSTDSWWKTFQTIGFSAVFGVSLVRQVLRKYFFVLSGILFIFMAVLFILGQVEWAEIFGSSGFGLVLFLLISYLPQITEKGYIEDL